MQREAEDRLEVGQPVRPAEVHLVAVEYEPDAERERLRDDREVHAADPAPECQIAKGQPEERRDEHDGQQGEGAAVEGLPEERERRDLVPHHEVG
jgi:hypothetical protein